MPVNTHKARALLFDVFGTCVNWRSTVTAALYKHAHAALNDTTASLATAVRLRATDMALSDWGDFAQQWRDSYKKFTKALSADDSAVAWKSIDEHHLDSLRELLAEWRLEGLWLDHQVRTLSLVWHFLDPWPDSPTGIAELNKQFATATLSNGNLSLLDDLKTHARLPFTHVLSAETFGAYKPSPRVYNGAAEQLGLAPEQCVMVAAHLGDLKAAKACGYQTIYVERPQEEDWSAQQMEAARTEGWVDLWIAEKGEGFVAAAEQLRRQKS